MGSKAPQLPPLDKSAKPSPPPPLTLAQKVDRVKLREHPADLDFELRRQVREILEIVSAMQDCTDNISCENDYSVQRRDIRERIARLKAKPRP